MIVSNISESSIYGRIYEPLAVALRWLADNVSTVFTPGTYIIGQCAAGEIYAKCEEPALMPRENVSLEAHKQYIDIHVPLKGKETIGWAPVSGLRLERAPYDADRDIAFYGDAAQALIHLYPGQCAIFFPDDAHAPNIGLGKHRKLCIKIPIEQ